MTAEELLKDPEIAQFMQTHQGATAERVSRAARNLAGRSDDLKALKKVLPALDEKTIRIFFSYKKKDEHTALTIMDQLRVHSDKLQICSMADFTSDIAGRPYRDFIHEQINRANWFVLLLPDPSDDWDWCLYEAGLFEANITSADRLICIHHQDIRVPSQISGYQAVAATIPDMEDFLRGLFLREGQLPGLKAINAAIEPKIPELAQTIVAAIRPPHNIIRRTFPAWVELKLGALDPADGDALDQAAIAACNNEALQLFHFLRKPQTWGKLRSNITSSDGRWLVELGRTIGAIRDGQMFEPIQAVFNAPDGKIYRPIACAVDRFGGTDGLIDRYHLAFVEEVSEFDHSALPANISMLASVLRFSFRFRWEVLEPFSKAKMVEEDVIKLENTILRMKADWYSRGIRDFSAVLQCFPAAKAERIAKIMQQWQLLNNKNETGTLDVAMNNKDVAAIPGILQSAIPLSQEFLEIAADRFSEIVAQ